jgi:hypothetical protein
MSTAGLSKSSIIVVLTTLGFENSMVNRNSMVLKKFFGHSNGSSLTGAMLGIGARGGSGGIKCELLSHDVCGAWI